MSAVVVAGDISGAITIQAPADAGNATLTLPTVAGTLLTSGSIGAGISITNTSGSATINANGSTINNQPGSYVAVASDAGKTIVESLSAATITFNISVFNAGDIISVVNTSAGSITLVQGASVTLRLANSATTGTRTLASNGVATLICTVGGATPTFYCSGAGLT